MWDAPSLCVVRHGFHSFKYISYFPHSSANRRVRAQTYAATLTLLQEVEIVEGGEGDAPSRLRIGSSIVGERRLRYLFIIQNLSDGFRVVVMSVSGRTHMSSKSVGGIC